MSIDEPASGSGAPESASLGDLPAGSRRVMYARGLDGSRRLLLPWRNLRRAVFLILALMAVVALKRSAGGFFSRLLESVASPPAAAPAHAAPETTVHLQPGPPPK
jgi:hypothetical protein